MWFIFAGFGVVLLGAVALTGAMYYKQERNSFYNSSCKYFSPSCYADFVVLALDHTKYNTTELKQANQLLTVGVGFVEFEPGQGVGAVAHAWS